MRRYRQPPSVLPRPAVGVASVSLLTVRGRVTGASVDDREAAHHANPDVVCPEILDRYRDGRLLEKSGAVDEGFVGIRAVKILRKDLVETLDVGILHRGNIVPIEHCQFVDVIAHASSSCVPPNRNGPFFSSLRGAKRRSNPVFPFRGSAGVLRYARNDDLKHRSLFYANV